MQILLNHGDEVGKDFIVPGLYEDYNIRIVHFVTRCCALSLKNGLSHASIKDKEQQQLHLFISNISFFIVRVAKPITMT
jgi:hypothetical protein